MRFSKRVKNKVMNKTPSKFWSMKANPSGASIGNFVSNVKGLGEAIQKTIINPPKTKKRRKLIKK